MNSINKQIGIVLLLILIMYYYDTRKETFNSFDNIRNNKSTISDSSISIGADTYGYREGNRDSNYTTVGLFPPHKISNKSNNDSIYLMGRESGRTRQHVQLL